MKKPSTGPLASIKNTRPWADMSPADRQLAAHLLDKQVSSIGNQLSLDVTAGLKSIGMPAHLEVKFKLVFEPGTDPRGDGT